MSEGSNNPQRIDQEFENLDFSEIRFPSDDLKIGAIRQQNLRLFDHGFQGGTAAQPQYFLQPNANGHVVSDIGMLLFCERLIVTGAYASRKGVNPPEGFDLEAAREELADFYCKHTLATGPQHAAQLIRELEREGVLLVGQKSR